MENTILLNSDYNFLNVINWKRAILLVIKEKVEVLKGSDTVVKNSDGTVKIQVPRIVRLVKMVKTIYKSSVPFNKKSVIYRDKGICQYCNTKIEKDITIDHILPKSKGGISSFTNCVVCCKSCNNKKGDKFLQDSGMKLIRKPRVPTVVEFMLIKFNKAKKDESKWFEDLKKYLTQQE
jgi:5-methylcytosine-specific restriction endonuclease McrA